MALQIRLTGETFRLTGDPLAGTLIAPVDDFLLVNEDGEPLLTEDGSLLATESGHDS